MKRGRKTWTHINSRQEGYKLDLCQGLILERRISILICPKVQKARARSVCKKYTNRCIMRGWISVFLWKKTHCVPSLLVTVNQNVRFTLPCDDVHTQHILTSTTTLSAASLLFYFPSLSVVKLLATPSWFFLIFLSGTFQMFPSHIFSVLFPPVVCVLPSAIRQLTPGTVAILNPSSSGVTVACHHQTGRPDLHRVSWWRLQSNAMFHLFQGGLQEVSYRGHKHSFDLSTIKRLKTVYILPCWFILLSHQLNKMTLIWHGKANGGWMKRTRLSTQAADVSSRMKGGRKEPDLYFKVKTHLFLYAALKTSCHQHISFIITHCETVCGLHF